MYLCGKHKIMIIAKLELIKKFMHIRFFPSMVVESHF